MWALSPVDTAPTDTPRPPISNVALQSILSSWVVLVEHSSLRKRLKDPLFSSLQESRKALRLNVTWFMLAKDAHHKIYLANLAEARDEFPADSAAETLAQLPPTGFQAAVIKRGVSGTIVIDAAPVEVAAFPIRTGSTIGSGDAFAGGLVAGLDRNLDLVAAVRLGNAAAATFLSLGGPLENDFAEGVAALLAHSSSA